MIKKSDERDGWKRKRETARGEEERKDWGKLMGEQPGRHADWARAGDPPSEPMKGRDNARTGAGRLR